MSKLNELQNILKDGMIFEWQHSDNEASIEIGLHGGLYFIHIGNYYGGISLYSKFFKRVSNIASCWAEEHHSFNFSDFVSDDFAVDDFVNLDIEV